MEDAKITNEKVVNEEQVKNSPNPFQYNQRFPTILDTDDITFELGKQVLNKINQEKLLENLLKKSQIDVQELIKLNKILLVIKSKSEELEKSNSLYVKNNKTLDGELVNNRKEFSEVKTELTKLKEVFLVTKSKSEELEKSNSLYVINNKKLDGELVNNRKEFSEVKTELSQSKNELIESKNIIETLEEEIRNSSIQKAKEIELHQKHNEGKIVELIKENKELIKLVPKNKLAKFMKSKKSIKKVEEFQDIKDIGEW